MHTVGSFEAKTQLSALLERVAGGERIAITRRGVPVALLVPMPAAQKPDPKAAARRIRELRQGSSLRGLTIRQLIEQGRR